MRVWVEAPEEDPPEPDEEPPDVVEEADPLFEEEPDAVFFPDDAAVPEPVPEAVAVVP